MTGMAKEEKTDRKAGIRWTGLADGEAAAPRKLSVFICMYQFSLQLNKKAGLSSLHRSRLGGTFMGPRHWDH